MDMLLPLVSTAQVEWCERIDYFKHIERDGLAPTESVLR